MLNRNEIMDRLNSELNYNLCDYRKDIKNEIKNNIVDLVNKLLDNELSMNNRYKICIGSPKKWHEEDYGLYFNVDAYVINKNGKLDLILEGDIINDYSSTYDCGIQLSKRKIIIPINYEISVMGGFFRMLLNSLLS